MDRTQTAETGRLEQVVVNKPEVTVYFSGEKTTGKKDIRAFLGKEELQLQSLDRERYAGEALHYYIDLDISASISQERFNGVKTALKEFGKLIRDEDRITVITFGDAVEEAAAMTGAEIRAGEEWEEQIDSLQNPDQHTLFFEAINQTADKIEKETGNQTVGSVRNVMVVFTDGEDIATGKTTRTEAQNRLMQAGIPLYSFTTDETAREYMNSLGEFSRSVGGYLEILAYGEETEGFRNLNDHLLSSYRAVYTADNNVISNDTVSVTLENRKNAEIQQREVKETRWQKDETAPQITRVERYSASQIQVSFSEPMQGIGSAASYSFVSKNGMETLIPAYASPSSDAQSVLLTFVQPFPGGFFTLTGYDMKDQSMEQNLLEETKTFYFEEIETETETETETVTETEAETGTGTETETETWIETEIETVREAGTEIGSLIEFETDTESGNLIEFETDSESGNLIEFETAAETGNMEEFVSETDAGIFEEFEANSEMIWETEFETESETDTGKIFGSADTISLINRFSSLNIRQKGILGGGLFLALLLLVLLLRTLFRGKRKNAAGKATWNPDRPDSIPETSDEGKTVIMTVNDRTETYQIRIKKSLIVGRSANCDLRFSDPTMSRQHFILGLAGEELSITNLSQSGGTTVNGNLLKTGEYRLASGDIIGAGSMKLKIAWG